MKINVTSLRNHSLPRHAGVMLLTALLNALLSPLAFSAAAQPETARQLLDKAHAAPMETRAAYLLDAADLTLQQNQPQQSERILQEISELKLRDDQRARSTVLRARLLLQQQKPEQALALLQARELQQDSAQLPAREQADISILRAQALTATGKHYAAAQERIFVDPLLKAGEKETNRQEIQRSLMNMSAADLQQYRDKATDTTLRGWLSLALTAKANSPAPTLDAARKTGNTIVANTGNTAPQQIALLLPQSGKLADFGNAVRDGFLVAWYDAKHRGAVPPAVRMYDTENAGIVALYQKAINDGAGFVIGPLEKNQVAQFYAQALTTPLLALNRADTTQAAPANLYQFALAPEDETAQIATLARKDSRANALVIVAEEDSRSHEFEAFAQRWQSLGGNIAAKALFRDQQSLSTAIRSALNIPRSEARGKEMESLLNRNIEFTPHRRRDIDMVFMLAKPAQARLIKPLLNFYYANDLPLYSTSRIYSGSPNANTDRDAENVLFTEIPWVLQQSPLKQQILSSRPASKNYLRLFALGIDSFNIYPRLRQMETDGEKLVIGQTGALSLDAQRIVQRQLPLAEMRDGAPRVVDGNGIISTTNDNGRDSNVDRQNQGTQ